MLLDFLIPPLLELLLQQLPSVLLFVMESEFKLCECHEQEPAVLLIFEQSDKETTEEVVMDMPSAPRS